MNFKSIIKDHLAITNELILRGCIINIERVYLIPLRAQH